MTRDTIQIFFALIRSAIGGMALSSSEKELFSEEMIPALKVMSQKHDVVHLVSLGLKKNGLLSTGGAVPKSILEAVFRYEQLNYEYKNTCNALEEAGIPFMPLKGAVLRKYYPEEWMRTSCDIDIFVHRNNLDKAMCVLMEKCGYTMGKKGSHDVSLFAPSKAHVELHYSLMEDGRVMNSTEVLDSVWDSSVVREGYKYWYEMTDEMFYFYHIVHMAKHFEKGGCGIRTFIDLWFLDRIENADESARSELLKKGGLMKFAEACRKLSSMWFDGAEKDELFLQMEEYVLYGGVYGTVNNTAKIQAAKGVSKTDSFFKIMFLPKNKLEEIYPNLKKRPFLFPFYQVKRWFRVFNKKKREEVHKLTKIRNSVSKKDENLTKNMLEHIGLSKTL